MAGTDISKFALRAAARREREVEFAVASSYRLPLESESLDVLLNCFSPLALEEFQRVLRPGGWFFYVVPGPEHLWEMKEILYDVPYPNEEKETPYFWRTPKAGSERLAALETLEIRISFRVHVFQKEALP